MCRSALLAREQEAVSNAREENAPHVVTRSPEKATNCERTFVGSEWITAKRVRQARTFRMDSEYAVILIK